MKILGGRFIELAEPVSFLFTLILFRTGREDDSGSVRQQAQCLPKVKAVSPHDKRKYVAAAVTAEAMPALSFRIDEKRRSFFSVERTQSGQVPSGFLQRDLLADNVGNVGFLFYVFNDTHGT